MSTDRKILIIILLLWAGWFVRGYVKLPLSQVQDDSYVKVFKTYLKQGKQEQITPKEFTDSFNKSRLK